MTGMYVKTADGLLPVATVPGPPGPEGPPGDVWSLDPNDSTILIAQTDEHTVVDPNDPDVLIVTF